ncbi:MAG: integrase, partial [Alphaproteobacteria bacterium]|nr:integrase [Alphaproteobacteria bacterium]
MHDTIALLKARASEFAKRARAPATEAAYAGDWGDFERWCAARDLASLPAAPETVALYLADRSARLKVSTMQRRLAAIVVTHRRAGRRFDADDPALTEVWRGIRRSCGTARRGKR